MKKQTRHEAGIKAFGQCLRVLRLAKGFMQEQLAYSSDLEFSQISRIKRGIINTSISQVFQIAAALGLPPKERFDFEIGEGWPH
ncbi:MAG: helix-turn-helix transcriptional regulator [Saprospiraceae bacterium]|nr:helix-turn-helix transcriptional regulator [Saprospiraceae bacterium]